MVATALIVTFFVTSADSGSLVMSMIASGGQVEPKRPAPNTSMGSTTRAPWMGISSR